MNAFVSEFRLFISLLFSPPIKTCSITWCIQGERAKRPMGPGKRVACPFQSLQMPPSCRVCPRLTRTGVRDRVQNRKPVLLLLEVWEVIQNSERRAGLT